MATFGFRDTLASPAPVSRRALVTTLGAGAAGIAAIASIEARLAGLPVSRSASAAQAGSVYEVEASTAVDTMSIVRGSVSLDLTAEVLERFPTVTRTVRLRGGSTARLSGVALHDLLVAVGAASSARVRVTSVAPSGSSLVGLYTPAEVTAPAAIIATKSGGRPLTAKEGGPARLVVGSTSSTPSRVVRIEVLG